MTPRPNVAHRDSCRHNHEGLCRYYLVHSWITVQRLTHRCKLHFYLLSYLLYTSLTPHLLFHAADFLTSACLYFLFHLFSPPVSHCRCVCVCVCVSETLQACVGPVARYINIIKTNTNLCIHDFFFPGISGTKN